MSKTRAYSYTSKRFESSVWDYLQRRFNLCIQEFNHLQFVSCVRDKLRMYGTHFLDVNRLKCWNETKHISASSFQLGFTHVISKIVMVQKPIANELRNILLLCIPFEYCTRRENKGYCYYFYYYIYTEKNRRKQRGRNQL